MIGTCQTNNKVIKTETDSSGLNFPNVLSSEDHQKEYLMMETFQGLFLKLMKNSAAVQTLAVRNSFFHCFLNEKICLEMKIKIC